MPKNCKKTNKKNNRMTACLSIFIYLFIHLSICIPTLETIHSDLPIRNRPFLTGWYFRKEEIMCGRYREEWKKSEQGQCSRPTMLYFSLRASIDPELGRTKKREWENWERGERRSAVQLYFSRWNGVLMHFPKSIHTAGHNSKLRVKSCSTCWCCLCH